MTFTVTRHKNVIQNDFKLLRNVMRVGNVSLSKYVIYPTTLKHSSGSFSGVTRAFLTSNKSLQLANKTVYYVRYSSRN